MGYARYLIGDKECGYAVPDVCNQEGCNEKNDRGLAYACGDYPGGGADFCDGYFCGAHMLFTDRGQRCPECAAYVAQDLAEEQFDYDNAV